MNLATFVQGNDHEYQCRLTTTRHIALFILWFRLKVNISLCHPAGHNVLLGHCFQKPYVYANMDYNNELIHIYIAAKYIMHSIKSRGLFSVLEYLACRNRSGNHQHEKSRKIDSFW